MFFILMSIINGLLNTGLLIFLNNTINHKPLPVFPEYDWLIFVLLFTVSLLSGRLFQTYLVRLTTDIRSDLQIAILRKLKHATYQDFKKLGNEKVFTAMGDINMLVNLPEVFLNVIKAIIIIVCCFIYLFSISLIGAVFIFFLMLGLLIFYLVRNKAIEKRLNAVRDLQNYFWRYLSDLLLGFKETKMSLVRNENIQTRYLEKNVIQAREMSKEANIRYLNNELTGSFSWYLTLGIIMFLLPRLFDLSHLNTTAYLITILYMMGPVAVLISLISTYTNVKISLERLTEFNQRIGSHLSQEETLRATDSFGELQDIRLEHVTYEYFDEKEQKTFFFGPLDLEIRKGELMFIVGGNGSGKTTFIYLLTGLYRPTSGNIYINDQLVTDENMPIFRNRFSVIHSDNYLFGENYDGFDLQEDNLVLKELIEKMKMSEILKLNDRNLFGTSLSKGQQKRLAMIYSLLEDRQIIVLDEWAAEQDPSFRNYFYKVLLPELKEKGKTVIVITHDDEYYKLCDRLIKFSYGKIVMEDHIGNNIFERKAEPFIP
ncbi:MAG: cyclic peptide export ABC transporter [Chitinophagaceae bacterium]|nr:cyclic peptide export ABC transporter [Chitinophagaceae bacterium]